MVINLRQSKGTSFHEAAARMPIPYFEQYLYCRGRERPLSFQILKFEGYPWRSPNDHGVICIKHFTKPPTEDTIAAMTITLLTIAEATEKTNRSASTIRRIIRTITDDPSHPDREGIEPTQKEVTAFKKKGDNFTWKIREDVLMKHCASAPKENKKSMVEREEIVHMLQRELTLKNQQIEKQFEVIQSLNERIREGNILMGSLQKHLALPSAEGRQTDLPMESSITASSKESPVMASKSSAKNIAKTPSLAPSAKSSKKGIFGWMFKKS